MGYGTSVRAAEAQDLVAVFGHPVGAGEVCIVYPARALGLGVGVDAEQDFDGFLPVSTVRLGIEQTTIEFTSLKLMEEYSCQKLLVGLTQESTILKQETP